ncbi:MAG TPA: tetratricopeptide repeat protein [Mobilitalea sp.]|nr:tetratricopeptide repeat protein [Mobilitalea sp.]
MKKKLLIYGLFGIMLFLLSGCSSAGGYYRSGIKSFEKGNYEAAATNFSAAIANSPNRADYYIDYGMTLIALERYEEAIEQFDKAYMDKNIIMVKENNERALRGKGIAYYNIQQYEEAISLFDLALNIGVLSELNMDILYYKGSAQMTIGAYEDARDTYTVILDTYGKDAEALGKRAYSYRQLEDYEKSLADYDMAISMAPNRYEYYFGKYYLMYNTKDEAGVATILEQAAQIKVDSKEDKYNQAKVHYYQGLDDMALAELSESYANGFTEGYYYIGEIYARKKDYSTAIYYYQEYIKLGENTNPSVYNQAAYCMMSMGDYDQAVGLLEKGIAYDNAATMKALLRNEIIAYENLGDFDIALEKAEDYLVLYPGDDLAAREAVFLETRQDKAISQEVEE